MLNAADPTTGVAWGPLSAVLEQLPEIDFDSDEPLVCPFDKEDGEACEACQ